jgi:hypothetical protein
MVSLERGLLEDIEEGIPQLADLPQLIVIGEHEYFPLRKKAKEWNERHPSSVYVTVPDAGHIANHDNPAAFNETLIPFLETLDRSTSGRDHLTDRETGKSLKWREPVFSCPLLTVGVLFSSLLTELRR